MVGLRRLHIDHGLATFLVDELNPALDEGEKGVISAHANIHTGMPFSASLSCDDIASQDRFATIFLDSKAPARGIPAIS